MDDITLELTMTSPVKTIHTNDLVKFLWIMKLCGSLVIGFLRFHATITNIFFRSRNYVLRRTLKLKMHRKYFWVWMTKICMQLN